MAQSGQLQSYFEVLGSMGSATVATDDAELELPLDAAVNRAIALVTDAKSHEQRIFFVGNGGSAGIASHMTTDWMKNGGFAALCLNDGSQLTCLGNDLGFDQIFAKPLSMHARAGDVLIAISSSGNSANILNAVESARKRLATVITLSGFRPDNKLRRLGDVNFYVPIEHYGFVEISHLAICHALLDLSMGWHPGAVKARAAV